MVFRRLRRRVFQLKQLPEEPGCRPNVRLAEYSTDLYTLNVVIREIQRDKEYEKVDRLKHGHYAILLVE